MDRLLLNYYRRCTAQAKVIAPALAESDPDGFINLPKLPILATFKTVMGTAYPLKWMRGPYVLPCKFSGHNIICAMRFKNVPSVLLFGAAAPMTDQVALGQVLEEGNPELSLVYTFEAVTIVIVFETSPLLDSLKQQQRTQVLQVLWESH